MKVRYCVANIWVNGGKGEVRFYAYREGPYGLHLVGSILNPDVVWYDTKEEAKKHIMNSTNECLVDRAFWNE